MPSTTVKGRSAGGFTIHQEDQKHDHTGACTRQSITTSAKLLLFRVWERARTPAYSLEDTLIV